MIERDVMFKPGATFYQDGRKVMFRYQADSSSVIGPREATDADKEAFAFEWDQFNVGRLPQLDRDFDGRPGGSLPIEEEVAPQETSQPKRRGRPKKAV